MKEKYDPVNQTITISVEEYERLMEADSFLACLENAGVDNWQGYEIACEEFRETKKGQP